MRVSCRSRTLFTHPRRSRCLMRRLTVLFSRCSCSANTCCDIGASAESAISANISESEMEKPVGTWSGRCNPNAWRNSPNKSCNCLVSIPLFYHETVAQSNYIVVYYNHTVVSCNYMDRGNCLRQAERESPVIHPGMKRHSLWGASAICYLTAGSRFAMLGIDVLI